MAWLPPTGLKQRVGSLQTDIMYGYLHLEQGSEIQSQVVIRDALLCQV